MELVRLHGRLGDFETWKRWCISDDVNVHVGAPNHGNDPLLCPPVGGGDGDGRGSGPFSSSS